MEITAPSVGSLRVVVVEDDNLLREVITQTLATSFGYQVVGQAATGLEMVAVVLAADPDVVLFDINLPELNGLDALQRIRQQKAVAAVAMTADRDPVLVQRASQQGVLGFLLKPFEQFQLGPTLHVAHARFKDLRGAVAEKERLQQVLDDRKRIERAKGVLMKRHRWTEADTFRRMQRAAMNRRMSMGQLAQEILNGVEVDL